MTSALLAYSQAFPDLYFGWQALCVDEQCRHIFIPLDLSRGDVDEAGYADGLPALAARLPLDALVKSEQFTATGDDEKTAFHDLFFRRSGAQDFSRGIWAHRDDRHLALLTVDVPGRYGTADRQALDASLANVLPHLQNAFRLTMERDIRRTRGPQAQFWIEMLPSAAFLTDGDGVVTIANAAAISLMKTGAGISVGSGGRLAFASDAQRDAVGKPLQRCLKGGESGGPFAVPAPTGHRLSAYCLALPPGETADPVLRFFAANRRECLLVMVDANDQPSASAATLATVLGLSPAEARLLSRLCMGGDLRGASAALGISYNTARTQIASATGKLGFQRQSELMAAAAQALARIPPPGRAHEAVAGQ